MSAEIDIASHLGAVVRVVEDRVHEGEKMRVVIASRAYDTSIADLWDALTSKERLPRWFARVDGELELGGRYPGEGQCRWRDHGLRSAEIVLADMGVWRRRELDEYRAGADQGGRRRI